MNDLRPLVTDLAAQRRASPALRRGSLQCQARGADAVEIVRKQDGEAVT